MREFPENAPLRIAFLCGSLEPGRDGVGDYCRLLAAELERLGHSCLLISLNERGASATPEPEGTEILRLPASASWEERRRQVRARLAEFQADWVSLQFVAYAFHEKGLVQGLGRFLQGLLTGQKVHVMFHELWIGGYARAPWREACIGLLQRACILRLCRALAPDLVTTTNAAYAALLAGAGIKAGVLPLFGNIPIAPAPKEAALPEELSSRWLFVFFGTLHPVWSPEPLFSEIRRAAESLGRQVAIVSIGRLGPGEGLWSSLAETYGSDFRWVTLGELPSARVSQILQAAHFGIAASPWELIGKSGSAVAMLEHGLPVIVSRDDVHFAGFREERAPAGLLKLAAGLPEQLARASRRPARSRLPEVAQLFLRELRARPAEALLPVA